MLDNYVLDFVLGKLTFDEFGSYMENNPQIWDALQSLMTAEMIDDRHCSFWTTTNYQIFSSNNFDVKATALAFGYESEYGKTRVHMVIGELVEYTYPHIKRKYPISNTPTSILEQIGMSYVEGVETYALLRQLICDIPDNLPKKEQMHLLKNSIRQIFHLIPRKVPRWVQEPEWPMGKQSPMAYVKQCRDGDLVKFIFRDVDTGDIKEVEQFY